MGPLPVEGADTGFYFHIYTVYPNAIIGMWFTFSKQYIVVNKRISNARTLRHSK